MKTRSDIQCRNQYQKMQQQNNCPFVQSLLYIFRENGIAIPTLNLSEKVSFILLNKKEKSLIISQLIQKQLKVIKLKCFQAQTKSNNSKKQEIESIDHQLTDSKVIESDQIEITKHFYKAVSQLKSINDSNNDHQLLEFDIGSERITAPIEDFFSEPDDEKEEEEAEKEVGTEEEEEHFEDFFKGYEYYSFNFIDSF